MRLARLQRSKVFRDMRKLRNKRDIELCCDCKRRIRVYKETGVMLKPKVPYSYHRISKVGTPEELLADYLKQKTRPSERKAERAKKRPKDIDAWIKAQLE